MMYIKQLTFCALAALAQPTSALAEMCDGGPGSPAEIEEAWDYGKSFANGDVIISALFVDAFLANGQLMIVKHPRLSDLADAGLFPTCTLIYNQYDDLSYYWMVKYHDATATYDPDTGLRVVVPVQSNVPGDGLVDHTVTIQFDLGVDITSIDG